MNGKDLISNLIDELSRARELLQLYVDGIEVPETTSEELINDIDSDLDRFYDVADSINACVEDIEYHSDRNLDSAQIARLASCNYIAERHNILLLGATGSGKTYLACALGMAAVRNFLSVRYVRLPELLTELAIARSSGNYRKVIVQYKKPALLILDEWLLYPLKETEARDLLEIAEARYKKASTIFCSQFDVPGWPEKLGDPIIADAICDRIVHDSYSVVIECKESMRKRKGVTEI